MYILSHQRVGLMRVTDKYVAKGFLAFHVRQFSLFKYESNDLANNAARQRTIYAKPLERTAQIVLEASNYSLK